MLCQNCGLKNATSIFMPPNETKIKYLCGECYKKINNEFELEKFAFSSVKKIEIEATCKNCGLTFKEFNSSGLFGCEKCYQVFEEYISTNVLPIFKEKKYLGKKPNLYYVQEEIKNLEQLIEMCLKNGNFQKATYYGRELKKLKEENYDTL